MKYCLFIDDLNFIQEINIINKLRKASKDAFNALHSNGSYQNDVDWNSHEDDLIQFSKLKGSLTFNLFIDNSNNNFYYKTFKDGKLISVLTGNEAHKAVYHEYRGK